MDNPDRASHSLESGEMGAKQGAQCVISTYRAKPTFCGSNLCIRQHLVSMGVFTPVLCRCRNSRVIVVSSRVLTLCLGLRGIADIRAEGELLQ